MGMGGSKGGSMPSVQPASSAPVVPSYTDNTAAEEAKTKANKALLAMRGRQSTILTADKLEPATVGKKTLLSGAA